MSSHSSLFNARGRFIFANSTAHATNSSSKTAVVYALECSAVLCLFHRSNGSSSLSILKTQNRSRQPHMINENQLRRGGR
eukprot:IDg7175t1